MKTLVVLVAILIAAPVTAGFEDNLTCFEKDMSCRILCVDLETDEETEACVAECDEEYKKCSKGGTR